MNTAFSETEKQHIIATGSVHFELLVTDDDSCIDVETLFFLIFFYTLVLEINYNVRCTYVRMTMNFLMIEKLFKKRST